MPLIAIESLRVIGTPLALTDAVPDLYSRREAYNVREKGSDAVRTNFAAHMYSEPFARLARHPRMVEPVEDLFGEKLYMHQFKINGKMAFEGDVWQWHQDYGTWKADDGMPEARAMNLAVFVDEVNEFNGPLYFIPRSHKKGAIEAINEARAELESANREVEIADITEVFGNVAHRFSTYEKAGFPHYNILPDGYPETLDIDGDRRPGTRPG